MTDTKRALTVGETVQGQIIASLPEFKAALPAHIPAEKFVRTAITAIKLNPDILKVCGTNEGKTSLFGALHKMAADGLIADGREAALVVYSGTAQYMPMIAGILKKARNSGEIASLAAHVVYEKDTFKFTKGDDESITHEPFLDGEPGDIKYAYAIAHLKDGTIQREIMSRADIERVRNASRAKDGPAWKNWFPEMARKSVLKRLCKYLPSSTDREADLLRLLQEGDAEYDFESTATDITPASASSVLASVEHDADGVVLERPQELTDFLAKVAACQTQQVLADLNNAHPDIQTKYAEVTKIMTARWKELAQK